MLDVVRVFVEEFVLVYEEVNFVILSLEVWINVVGYFDEEFG